MTFGHVHDHLARGDVEGSVVACDAAPHVVVGSVLGESWSQQQDRGGAVKSLHLGLLVHTEHQRAFEGIEVKAHDVTDYFNQLGIGG